MSKSLKNFITIDVGGDARLRTRYCLTSVAGDTSEVFCAPAAAGVLDTTLDRQGRLLRVADDRRSANYRGDAERTSGL